MFKRVAYLNVQETGYHSLEKNRILSLGILVVDERQKSKIYSWNATTFAEEHQLLLNFKEVLESMHESTTLFITYDGKDYDYKMLLSRALVHDIDVSKLFSCEHVDVFTFLKSYTLFSSKNIFDVASFLNCSCCTDDKREKLKEISASALLASDGIKAVEKYNLTILTILAEIFEKTKKYMLSDYEWGTSQKRVSSEDTIFA